MTARTPYAGTISALDPETASNFNRLPGGWLLHVESATTVSTDTTTVDVPGMTSPSFTAVSTRVYKHTFNLTVSNNATGNACNVFLTDGSNGVLARFVIHIPTASTLDTITGFFFESGISGSLARKLRINFGGGTGAVQAATAGCASQYMIEDVGSTT